MNNVNAEERLGVIVSYFTSAISRLKLTPALEELQNKVLNMTIDEFECIYQSLLPEEQIAFDPNIEFTVEQEMSQYMIYTKTLNRYWDAKNGYTSMDDDGILVITEDSSFLEIPVSLNTYTELSQLGAYSIKDMREKVTANILTSDTLLDISAAVIKFEADSTIRMEGSKNE